MTCKSTITGLAALLMAIAIAGFMLDWGHEVRQRDGGRFCPATLGRCQ